jgi:hypothetical protein
MSTPESNPGLRALLEPYLRRNRAGLAVLAAASLFGGFAEAAVLVVIARVAFAITQQDSSVTVSAGPVGPYDGSVPALIALAAVATLVRWRSTSSQHGKGRRSRAAFAGGAQRSLVPSCAWGLQSGERQCLQELLTVHVVYPQVHELARDSAGQR